MKIVIDIDSEVYNFIKSRGHIPYAVNIANEIANGTPLPKVHGDLIDRDVAYDEFDKACFSYEGGLLNRIPAVIPADKEVDS